MSARAPPRCSSRACAQLNRISTGPDRPMFETITLAYDPHEDRIFVATDLGKPTAAPFWLTRRMTLAVLAQAADLLSQTSPLTAAATAQDRQEVAAFER